MNKNKNIRTALRVAAFFAFFGIIIGIIGSISSYVFYAKLNDFKKIGKEARATIDYKREKSVYRVHTFFVDLNYTTEEDKLQQVEDVEVNALLYDKLHIGKQVNILHKNNEVILTDNYISENVPPIKSKKSFWLLGISIVVFIICKTLNRQQPN